MNRALVVIPTYNEVENLEDVVHRIVVSAPDVDILVVDDDSPDGTGALADALAEASPRLRVLHRAQKSGLGDAYRAGFAWGLARGYELLIEMDGDGSHRPEHLPELIAGAKTADVVLGSRWIAGGGAPNWSFRRTLLSRAGSLYARWALGLPLRDVTGGFRVFRAEALRRIDYSQVASQGYCFQVEMAWRAASAGLSIVELPIRFEERVFGASKMSLGIVAEAIARVTLWGITGLPKRVRRSVPLRGRLSDS
jgi:dolichol-phosphate mannosyltransferase